MFLKVIVLFVSLFEGCALELFVVYYSNICVLQVVEVAVEVPPTEQRLAPGTALESRAGLFAGGWHMAKESPGPISNLTSCATSELHCLRKACTVASRL